MNIQLQQTSSRHVFIAYADQEEIGEFRGYGKTDDERMESARQQAKQAIEKRKSK